MATKHCYNENKFVGVAIHCSLGLTSAWWWPLMDWTKHDPCSSTQSSCWMRPRSYNVQRSDVTNKSPFELAMGQQPLTPGSLLMVIQGVQQRSSLLRDGKSTLTYLIYTWTKSLRRWKSRLTRKGDTQIMKFGTWCLSSY